MFMKVKLKNFLQTHIMNYLCDNTTEVENNLDNIKTLSAIYLIYANIPMKSSDYEH